MKRRTFLQNFVAATSGAFLPTPLLSSRPVQWFPDKKIITISYNVYQFKGYPETDDTKFMLKDMRPQMPDRMALELSLYKPHIVTFQEAPAEEAAPEPEAAPEVPEAPEPEAPAEEPAEEEKKEE